MSCMMRGGRRRGLAAGGLEELDEGLSSADAREEPSDG